MYAALIIILALLVILFISIAQVYKSIPLIELKRRARAGHEPAKSLYKVASYKYSSQIFLLLLATIAAAFYFVLISRKSPLWVSLISSIALIWLAYVWIPRSSVNIVSQYFAQVLAKPLAWILQYIHPQLKHVHKDFDKPRHTGLYEREDIVKLLSLQQKQEDNRIDDFEIDLLKHVLDFDRLKVIDLMTPKSKVNAISVKETLGPIVLSELHKTNHTYFPVYENRTSNIVGILGIASLGHSKNTISVDEVMNPSIYYVHEEQNLGEVLQVMIKTSQEIFIVINGDQEYVGIVTAREILKELVGETLTEEFDQYDNREMVANKFNPKEEVEVLPEIEQETKEEKS